MSEIVVGRVSSILRYPLKPADRDVLRTIAATNSIDVLQTGTLYPCAGVYADVLAEGEIRGGDPVRIIG